MDTVGAGNESSHGVGNRQSAIAMAMPVNANLLAGGLDYFVDDKADQSKRPHRGRMSCGIANDDRACAAIDRGCVQPPHHLRIAACRVFRYVHHVKTERYGVFHCCFRSLKQKVVAPSFGVAADRAGTEKGGGFNLQSGPLHNFRDRPNVILKSAGSAVGTNLHLVLKDLARQRLGVLHSAQSGARQAQVK
jgi:hypothetical protein